MKRVLILAAVFTAVFTLVLPFVGGAGPSFLTAANAATETSAAPVAASLLASPASAVTKVASTITAIPNDTEHVAQKPVPVPEPTPDPTAAQAAPTTSAAKPRTSSGGTAQAAAPAAAPAAPACQGPIGGSTGGAPGRTSGGGVAGTTSADLASFAQAFNQIRADNCLPPIAPSHIRYDSCMEDRLFWIAEDPSTDPTSAWGHNGTQRSDGLPAVGCDGNLAGGTGNSGSTVATKWWNSLPHRASLYRPSTKGSMDHVCILFAMTHGGVPNEPYSMTRAAARWVSC